MTIRDALIKLGVRKNVNSMRQEMDDIRLLPGGRQALTKAEKQIRYFLHVIEDMKRSFEISGALGRVTCAMTRFFIVGNRDLADRYITFNHKNTKDEPESWEGLCLTCTIQVETEFMYVSMYPTKSGAEEYVINNNHEVVLSFEEMTKAVEEWVGAL